MAAETNLNHLEGGEVSLPPQVLLHLGSESRDEVVGVHDDVDQGVDGASEGLVAARKPAAQRPREDGHDPMMDHLFRDAIKLFMAVK